MSEMNRIADEFRCPGETGTISRAVHRARLAGFYPKCRGCPHRVDTTGFSDKLIERLAEVHVVSPGGAGFDADGITGAVPNELTPEVTRQAGAAFGLLLREQSPGPSWPTVLVAGDGRRLTSPLVAAVAGGLRWSGCHVVDVGAATSGCLAFGMRQSRADGGVLVGNPGHRSHEAGLWFWVGQRPLAASGDSPGATGVPPSATGVSPVKSEELGQRCAMAQAPCLEQLELLYHGHLDRPTREFGTLARVSFESDYLGSLAGWYHGIRPLRVVLDTHGRPLLDYVHRLSRSLACEFFDELTDTPAVEVPRHKAHFGVEIDGNGERARVWDERGEPVDDERLLQLIARHLREHGEDRPEPETADALVTLSLLLVILSQSDRPLSRVLDERVEG